MSASRPNIDGESAGELKRFLDGALAVFEGREGSLSVDDIQIRSLLSAVRRDVVKRIDASSAAVLRGGPYAAVHLMGGAPFPGPLHFSTHIPSNIQPAPRD
ncbi:MAG TPA: hypothetical protein VMB21_19070 [Candidatus Limnocylindria bacterium]|jgi:hypothetical protein|nr:hypothetical protein [Candidatus Limnocylindria bacterium]HTL69289.1 hypothetical protein [Lacunisphaera sp.]